jgi:hypothetical protein
MSWAKQEWIRKEYEMSAGKKNATVKKMASVRILILEPWKTSHGRTFSINSLYKATDTLTYRFVIRKDHLLPVELSDG